MQYSTVYVRLHKTGRSVAQLEVSTVWGQATREIQSDLSEVQGNTRQEMETENPK